MATQPCPDIAQVVIQFQYDAQNIQNTYYFENTGGWTTGDMTALASAVDTEMAGGIMAQYATDVVYLGCVATDLTDLTSERHRVERATPLPGTAVGTSAPGNVALVFTKLTGSRGKGQQGRVFIGPIPDSAVTGDKASEVWAGEYLTALEGVIDAAKASKPGTQHVVLSRYEGKVKRPFGIGKLVLSIAPSNFYVDSQRDRLPFHKKHRRPRTP